ncbi:MAG: NUDIX hydrolase [bacterium]|nr:NUDIX hydrolase [bacterium]
MKKVIQVVVIGVIKKGNKYLLTRRIHDNEIYHDKWQLPGGGLEFGEDVQDALRRELKEELDIEVEVVRLLPKIYHDVRTNWHGILLGFLCGMKDEHAKIILDTEASAYQWYTKEEVKSLNCLRYTYELIVEAEKQLNLKVTV